MTSTRPTSDMGLLVPAFRVNIERVLKAMRRRGFDPVVFETTRSHERAAWLVAQNRFASGTRSMHCYGLACDIISETHMWANRKFFDTLGAVAEGQGLTWGGRFKRADGTPAYDGPHIQAIPLYLQDDVRRLKTPDEVAALAVGYLSAVP